MSPPYFPAARVLHQCRAATILCLVIALLAESGCQSARQVRWSGRGHVTTATTTQTDMPAEPAMAANVALKTDQSNETESESAPATSSPASSTPFRIGNRFNFGESRPKSLPGNADLRNLDEPDSEGLVEAERSDSSMDRLNAALSDDGPSNSLPQRSLTSLDARVRVESLLSRARQLFEIGQLEQARQTAQAAQDLSETSQIDFFPDDDRPIDLIRRIDGQLKEGRVKSESDPERDSNESQVGHVPAPDEKPLSKASTTPEKDPTGLARIRRDWSTLFRREKKSSGDTSGNSTDGKLAKAEPINASRTKDVQVNHTAATEPFQAVVMANRSVSLESSDSSFSRSPTDAPELADPMKGESHSDHPRTISSDESPYLEATDSTDPSSAIMVSRLRSGIETGDTAVGQPDIEVVDVMTPFRQVKPKQDEAIRPEPADASETRGSDCIYLYVIFGICSLLALSCYRRGAT